MSDFEAVLPTGWLWLPLKHGTTLLNRGTAPDYADDGPVRMVSQAANQASGLAWERTRFHEFSGDATRLKGFLRSGDILINSTGTGTLGRVGFFTKSPDKRPCVADGHITVARASAKIFEPRFLYYWLSSSPFQDFIYAALIVGATNQIELNRDRLGTASVPLPPLDEQRRIADFLDAETARIDQLVALQRSVLDALHQRREGAVLAEVAGFEASDKRPSNLAWTKELPSSWKTVKLSLVARMGSGHTPSRSHPEWWTDCTVPWITTGEVSQVRDDRLEVITDTRESISHLGIANSSAEIHPKGTVVLCRTASAGYSGIMGRDMATSQDFVTWTCGHLLDSFYLLWCLRAMRSDLLGRLAMGSTHKTIYVPDLQMLKIPLPPLADQRRAVDNIHRSNSYIDGLADAINAQLALLTERRQALITAAVTGQFDVTTARGADLT